MANYKLVTYESAQGPRAGAVIAEKVFDIATLTRHASYVSMLDVLADWPAAKERLTAAATQADRCGHQPLDRTNLLAPVLWPSAIFCAGANFTDHMIEMAKVQNIAPEPDPHTIGLNPWHFIKASRAIAHPGAAIKLPPYSKMVDWEAELVAVIGRTAKDVPLDQALNYVAGYTIANDLSARDLTKRPGVPDGSPFKYDWVGQKNFDDACPAGPWIVPAEDIPDPQNLSIKLWVNDVIKQDSHTSKMIFTLAEQLSHLSSRITLNPGDLILTGTPSGVGLARGEFLKAGDVVKITIDGIGTLTNSCI
jgi:2-keto-4-pentenoate hydratase/2-oxohepta-3-ene-1,7-dioic acid hydratase in catechol pathway